MTNLNEPILPGTAASDYERYLRTDELLSLQKAPAEMGHRDELLFQTIHQTAELWLKLAAFEVETATGAISRDETWPAVRLLRRAVASLDLVVSGTMMLEHLAPWDYHGVRRGRAGSTRCLRLARRADRSPPGRPARDPRDPRALHRFAQAL